MSLLFEVLTIDYMTPPDTLLGPRGPKDWRFRNWRLNGNHVVGNNHVVWSYSVFSDQLRCGIFPSSRPENVPIVESRVRFIVENVLRTELKGCDPIQREDYRGIVSE